MFSPLGGKITQVSLLPASKSDHKETSYPEDLGKRRTSKKIYYGEGSAEGVISEDEKVS